MTKTVNNKEYPSQLLENREVIEGKVLSAILRDPLILEEVKLKPSHFITEDGMFYYGILNKLIREKKVSQVTDLDIKSTFSENIISKYEEKGGIATLNHLRDISHEDNLNSYLDDLYKANALIELHDEGFNMFKSINIEGKDIIPFELFKNMDTQAVIEFYETRLSGLDIELSNDGVEELIMDIDDTFIESLLSGEANGVPFDTSGLDVNGDEIKCLPYLSNQIQGFQHSTLSFVGGFSSVGKSTLFINIIMSLVYREERVLIISNEQRSKPFKLGFLSWILTNKLRYYKATKKKMMSGNISEEDLKMIKKAQDIFRKEYADRIFFVATPDSDINLAKKKIREYHHRMGATCFLYDTFKLDTSNTDSENFWLQLIKSSREFDTLAKKLDMIGLASVQLSISMNKYLWLDASCFSMSKQIIEIAENALLMRNAFPEEFDKSNKKFYCKPFRLVKGDDGKYTEQEIEIDTSKSYRVMFTTKCRSGENSDSSGVASLLLFNGNSGTFSEVAYCRPKHSIIN